MHKKFLHFCFLFIFLGTSSVIAQDKPARPDIPGILLFDIGFSTLSDNEVELLDIRLWESKTFNAYYLFDKRIKNSKFYFLPGFGLGLDKYGFDNAITLDVPLTNPDTTVIENLFNAIPGASIEKTKLATNYFDIPLEFRFFSNPDDQKSFRIGLGGKAGVLFSSHTKVKYERNDETEKIKEKRDFNISRFRYGLTGRIGYGSFGLYIYYGLNELFEDGEGPGASQMNQVNFGLTIVGF